MTDHRLKQFVEQIEGVNAEMKSLSLDRSELYKAAQQTGYEPEVLRRLISERAKPPAKRAEADELFRVYWDSIAETAPQPVLTDA
jgi:uncharacterized protein (UPF0335 family)